jgi:hypothetical protein
MGQVIGAVKYISPSTNGQHHSAIVICFGPVQIAYGKTSPMKRTPTTENMIAAISEIALFK